MKRKVVGGCSLAATYDTVKEMVDQKAANNINSIVRMSLQQHAFLLQTPLCISLRALSCSPFILQLAAAISARSPMYHYAATDDEGVWHVWHHSATSSRGQAECEITTLEFQFGAECDESGHIIKHVTTLTTCFCPFPSRWGIFCCHLAHLYVALNIAHVPAGVLAAAWLPISDEDARVWLSLRWVPPPT